MPVHAARLTPEYFTPVRTTSALAAACLLSLSAVGCGSTPSAASSRSFQPSQPAYAPTPGSLSSSETPEVSDAMIALSRESRPVDFSPHPNASSPATVLLPGNVVGVTYGAFAGHTAGSFETAARSAAARAIARPATSSEALVSAHADLDGDGFITADELAALTRTWSDAKVVEDRLDAIGARYYVDAADAGRLAGLGVEPAALNLMQARSYDTGVRSGVASVPTD